jgi:integrase
MTDRAARDTDVLPVRRLQMLWGTVLMGIGIALLLRARLGPVDRTKGRHADEPELRQRTPRIDHLLLELEELVVLTEVFRDVVGLSLPRWGRVVQVDGVVPWLVVDADGAVIAPIRTFFVNFVADAKSPQSVRSYAYVLLRWWRWLRLVGVEWDRATSAEARDLALWLGQATKRRNAARTTSVMTAGRINPITRKRNLDDKYAPRTIRHNNAVLRTFYDYWINEPDGPLINPVRLDRRNRGRRPHAHHNPLEPFKAQGRLAYKPKVPKRLPREIPDEQWIVLFAKLKSNRDRAIVATGVSSGARSGELLGMSGMDLDWGDQLIRVVRKGTRDEQWLPASAEAFVWLRLYLADLGAVVGVDEPLWWTLRRRDRGEGLRRQPLNYEALRAVFRRVNALLGTNWSMHDLRHTAALRMARDPQLSLRDVQAILGHAHLSTTADVYTVETQAEVIRAVARHLARRELQAQQPKPPVAEGYDAADLSVLLGTRQA